MALQGICRNQRVLYAGDQRMYVSFGPRAAPEIAASETLTPFKISIRA